VVDDEFGDVAHKEKSFADRVMFWRSGKAADANAPPQVTADNTQTPLDAQAEEDRIKRLTGGQTIVIQREGSSKIKLPGL
jgi:hypothetical protein